MGYLNKCEEGQPVSGVTREVRGSKEGRLSNVKISVSPITFPYLEPWCCPSQEGLFNPSNAA